MDERRAWLRGMIGLLALGHLVAGIWGVVDPVGWYESFPGLGHRWIFGDGPFNRHLAAEAGAGFLAIGVVLVFALVLARNDVMKIALAGYLFHVTPHFLYHLARLAAPLRPLDAVLSLTVLGGQVAVATVALIVVYTATPSVSPGLRAPERAQP
jgi:hypothetical protein